MPFLEVVTRCYKRPTMLAANIASLMAQTDPDWRQTFLVDHVGIGVAAANARLADVEPVGDYVWVLDDDDLCIEPRLVAILKQVMGQDCYVVQMDHGELGILPPTDHYGKPPVESLIGSSALICRADVWRAEREAWRSGRYASDFDFANSVFAHWQPTWLNLVASRIQQRSIGAPECI